MSQKKPPDIDQNIELDNAKSSGQIGQAGRDLIQVGRDYTQYIYNNSQNGHWGKVAFALIPLFLFLYASREVGIKVVETFSPKSEDSSKIVSPTQSPINQEPKLNNDSQLSEFQFPQNSCGDQSTGSNSTWYPVFINGGNLDEVKQKYCKNAINVTRQTGESTIQVASFTSDSKAQRFAQAVGGEVGETRIPGSLTVQPPKEPETQSPAITTPLPLQKPAEQSAVKQPPTTTTRPLPPQKPAERSVVTRPTGCIVTVGNPSLVSLMSKPDTFSQPIIRVDPGNYTSLEHIAVDRGFLGQEGCFKIEAKGRVGWVKDDTFTISEKTRICP